MIGTTLSHYEITAELGRGGMGVVYRAMDKELQRPVALKVMSAMELASDQAKARFRQEAQAAARLSHPNVATIYQIGEDEGKLFIAMELVEGQTLEAVIAAGISTDQALRIGAQLAEGIAAAHAQGIVHRDIKPANVMVSSDGRVKILDFGLAKTEAGANLTVEGSTVGTIAYMSPEQVRGEDVGPASDMWSMGVLLFEMLSGKRPFSAAYDAALSFQILNEAPPQLDESIPEGVREGVHALLAKEPGDRPRDARAFLSEYAPSGVTASYIGPSVEQSTKQSNRIPIIGVAVVLLVAIGAWLFWPAAPLDTEEQDGIAVFPFLVVGSEGADSFGDGFARLLTDRLDESGAVRTVEYNGLRSHIDESGGSVRSPETARGLAMAFHAEGYVFGDVVKVPGSIVVSASMFAADGVEVANAEVAIEQEAELLHAVNELGRQLLASRYGESGNTVSQAGALSTESYPALRSYLKGMELQRAAEFQEAYAAFKEATSLDSTFAMAWYGMGRMTGWGSNPRDPEGLLFDKALEYPDRIPNRFKDRIVALKAMRRGEIEQAMALFEEITQNYPDDADAWALRGDLHYHYNRWFGRPMNEALGFMERAQELDPGNTEMTGHLAIIKADENPTEHFTAFLDRYFETWRTRIDPEWIKEITSATGPVEIAILDSLAQSELSYLPIYYWLDLSEEPNKMKAYVERLDTEQKLRYERLLGWIAGKMEAHVRSGLDQPGLTFERHIPSITLLPAMAAPSKDALDATWDSFVVPTLETVDDDTNAGNPRAIAYHATALAIMRGNDSDARIAAAYLGSDSTETARGLETMLETRRLLLAGDYRGANKASDEAFRQFSYTDRSEVRGQIWPYQARLLKLEALAGMGQHEEVIQWIDILGDGAATNEDGSEALLVFGWWAPMAFMKGKAHMGLGQLDEAEVAFTRFIELWREADSTYQSYVEDAKDELERIADLRAREPAS